MKHTLALVLMVFGSFGIEAKNAYEFTNDYQSLLNLGLGTTSNRNEIKKAHDALQTFFLNSTDNRRMCVSVMGKEAYLKASKSERRSFLTSCSQEMSATLTQLSLTFRDYRVKDLKISRADKTQDWKFNLKGKSREIPFTFKVGESKNGDFKIINAVVNNVNLGLTYRNHFAYLYENHNGDYEIINAEFNKPSNPYILPEQATSKNQDTVAWWERGLDNLKEKYRADAKDRELQEKIDRAIENERARCSWAVNC